METSVVCSEMSGSVDKVKTVFLLSRRRGFSEYDPRRGIFWRCMSEGSRYGDDSETSSQEDYKE